MKQSADIGKLAAALVAAQSELKAVAKDSTNPHFKSRFASLDAIIAEVRPVLAKHGLALAQGATSPDRNEAGVVTAFTVETMLVHSSGEWITGAAVMPLAKSDPQGAGAALTYGRRYSLSSLLCLATDEDDDGNMASQQRSGGKEKGRAGNAGAAGTTQPLATAPSRTASMLLTRDSKWPAMPHLDVPVKDLPDEFVRWAVEPGRRLGQNTDAWQKVLREELLHRAANGAKAGV